MSLMTRTPSRSTGVLRGQRGREQSGYTLIEMVVAMAIGLVVSLGAFTFLEFASGDVSRVTDRVHVTQTGRVALEKIMLELHSVCVTPEVNPILQESNGSLIKFVSETGKGATFPTVKEHEIIYTAGSGTTEGTLIEKTHTSIGEAVKGNYAFSSTVLNTTRLLTGVRQTEVLNETTHIIEKLPIFRYYRYYHKADTAPVYGEVDPTPITPLTTAEAEELTKVTVNFTLAPEGKESSTFNHDRPVSFEDSALFRLSPPSTASEHINAPCSEQP